MWNVEAQPKGAGSTQDTTSMGGRAGAGTQGRPNTGTHIGGSWARGHARSRVRCAHTLAFLQLAALGASDGWEGRLPTARNVVPLYPCSLSESH